MAHINILKTTTANPHFLALERLLDAELRATFPLDMAQFEPHNKFSQPIKCLLLYKAKVPVACGAFKELGDHVEIKRMFVHPDYRRKGYSRMILEGLEKWSKSLAYQYAILETGRDFQQAVNLYQSSGYKTIPNYGPYKHIAESICMKKQF